MQTTKRPLQNVIVISIVWVFTFTAYSGLQNLEASLNTGLGIYSLASISGGGLLTCIIAPALIKVIGCKLSLIVSWVCFAIFVGVNYYPKTYLMIPGSVILGLSTGLLFTAQGIYITSSALEYSVASGEEVNSVMSKFFGIFCMALQSTQVIGNVISSLVLQTGRSNTTKDDLTLCGANDCPWNSNLNQTLGDPNEPDDTVVLILLSVYMGGVVIGFLITCIFLKPIPTPEDRESPTAKARLVSTFRLLCTDLNMVMLVPLSLFLGMEQVVIFAEFTKSFVTCVLGIEWVGYTMVCFGVCDALGSTLVGYLCRYTGRFFLFVCGAVLNLSVLLVLLLWQPSPSHRALFFVLPGLWGLADAVWQTQSQALVGIVYSDRQAPAFANQRMFMAMGFFIAYLYSSQMCQYAKIYLTGGVLVLSVVLVGIVEFRHKRKVKSRCKITEDK